MENTGKKVLLYDGSCRTCTVMKDAADMTVSNYEFLDATSDAGKKLVRDMNLDIDSSAYVLDGEKILSRSDMALEVMRDVRLIGPVLSATARLLPYSWREASYEWLVRHRIR